MVKENKNQQRIAEMYRAWKRGGKEAIQKLLEKRQAEAKAAEKKA